eukprot:641059-Rhodomonas_salina.2
MLVVDSDDAQTDGGDAQADVGADPDPDPDPDPDFDANANANADAGRGGARQLHLPRLFTNPWNAVRYICLLLVVILRSAARHLLARVFASLRLCVFACAVLTGACDGTARWSAATSRCGAPDFDRRCICALARSETLTYVCSFRLSFSSLSRGSRTQWIAVPRTGTALSGRVLESSSLSAMQCPVQTRVLSALIRMFCCAMSGTERSAVPRWEMVLKAFAVRSLR